MNAIGIRLVSMHTNRIHLGPVPVLSKLQIAERQLECALRLLMDCEDHVSAITLAGASEEILGKLLNAQGKENNLQDFVRACVEIGKLEFSEVWPEREFVSLSNYFRDGLKHFVDGEEIAVPQEAAVEIIDRAISNYWTLTGTQTLLMKRFMEHCHGV